MRGKVITIVGVFFVVAAVVWADGSVVETTFFSEALNEDKEVLVYLPEDYSSSGLDYPVIYYLHGAGGEPGSWYLTDFVPVLDQMIADGWVDPAIIVEPDSVGRQPPPEWQSQGLTGRIFHYHINSELLGNNEDFLAEDVVAWVDATYRTVQDRDHRLIVARSMGGHGAMRLTMRHPDVFSGASIDAGFMAMAEGYLVPASSLVLNETLGPPYDFTPLNGFYSANLFGLCAAFTPDMTDPPWYVDFVLDPSGQINEPVLQRMIAASPPALIAEYAGSDYPLDLFLRIGDQDEFAATFWPVIDALELHEVPHVLRTFEGSHWVPGDLEKIAIQMSYFMPIKATAEISPRVADPRLYPKRLRVALELPGDLDVADIDCTTLALIDIDGNRLDCPVGCSTACEVSDVNGNGRNDLSVWLSSERLAGAAVATGAAAGDEIRLNIRGELDDGRFFQATDTVTLANEPVANAVTE